MSCPTLLRLARRALLAESAGTSEATQLASAFNQLRSRLRSRLDGIFGQSAVAALFARGHGLAAEEFPWLAAEAAPGVDDSCYSPGPEGSAARPTVAIIDGLATELAECMTLLSTMIGTELTLHFAEDAWGTSLAGASRQGRPEWASSSGATDPSQYRGRAGSDSGNDPPLAP